MEVMKTLEYSGSKWPIARMLDEYLTIGYDAKIVDDVLLVYYGKQPRKQKRAVRDQEKWTKRERNFGYTRG
jgi:hypothetical protein